MDFVIANQQDIAEAAKIVPLTDEQAARLKEVHDGLRSANERLSREEYEGSDPRMRGLLDAYAAGFNEYLDAHPEARGLLERVEPWHTLALIRFKYYQNEFLGYAGLRNNWVPPMFARSAAAVAVDRIEWQCNTWGSGRGSGAPAHRRARPARFCRSLGFGP